MTTFIKQYEQTFPVLTTINLPVTKASGAAPTTAYSIAVANGQAGDLLTITGKTQVTNNLHKAPFFSKSNNVGVGSYLSYIDGQGAHQTITFPTGGNVDAVMHHATRQEATVWEVPQGVSGTVIICFRLQSAALQAKANWALRVDQGYGNLRIKHERP